ncbi:condensation domain-containing protein (plasmid) [Glutamicibacter sp. FR1]|uniref:condensation domain-containing protein n=1 Tax=Glutamicibacter sp. FR1 TaxID=3393744 RepID=UPI0039B010F5
MGTATDEFESCPLTEGQKGILTDLLFGGAPERYNIPRVSIWNELIDFHALESALQLIVDRHKALQWRLHRDEDGWNFRGSDQQISLTQTMTEVNDVRRLAEKLAWTPFDLEHGPLLRVALLSVGPAEHVLVVVMHHIISDGWSMQVFLRELFESYHALANQKQPSLPELPIQYADYALWQRERLTSPAMQNEVNYWRTVLADAPAQLSFPDADPTANDYSGETIHFRIDAETVEALKVLAKAENATLFMVLSAAFKWALYEVTGQTDLLVGTPVSGRDRPEVEHLIGFFVNTVILRTNLEGIQSFRELVRRERDVILDALDHAEVPFSWVSRSTGRIGGGGWLIDFALVVLEDLGRQTGDISRGTLPRYEIDGSSSKLNISLTLEADVQNWRGMLEINSALVNRSVARQLVTAFLDVLRQGTKFRERTPRSLQHLGLNTKSPVTIRVSPPRPSVGTVAVLNHTVTAAVRDLWQTALDYRDPEDDDEWFAWGGDSLGLTAFLWKIERDIGLSLDPAVIVRDARLGHIVEQLGCAERSFSLEKKHSRITQLSSAQFRLWFLNQMDPDSAAYNMGGSFDWPGTVDGQVLQSAVDHIVQRHESLRTTFSMSGGDPVQVISPSSEISVGIAEWAPDLDRSKREWLESQYRSVADHPFDLEHGPLLRVALLSVGPAEHVLVVVKHHIISDGWSMQVFLRELFESYHALANQKQPSLPELPIQYADYALWQRERLTSPAMQNEVNYWRTVLADAPAQLSFPDADPTANDYSGETIHFRIDAETVEALKVLAKAENATLFMVLSAAFKWALYEVTGQTDLLVGTPVSGRDRPEVEHLIGFFVNTVILRTNLEGIQSFRELVRRERDVILDAFSHQSLPFDELVRTLNPKRNSQVTPYGAIRIVFGEEDSSATLSESYRRVPTATRELLSLRIVADDAQLDCILISRRCAMSDTVNRIIADRFQEIIINKML